MGLAFPKPRGKRRPRYIPSLPEDALQFILGNAAPDDRKALAQIVETAHVHQLEDGTEILIVPATPLLLDRLAAFGAEAEDREWENEDDVETDDDRDNDNAMDDPVNEDQEPEDGEAPVGARKSREAFVERKRGEAVVKAGHNGIRSFRVLRPEGQDEVRRMRRTVGLPAKGPRVVWG